MSRSRSRSRSRERTRRRSRDRHRRRRSRSRERRRRPRAESPPRNNVDETAAWDRERERKRKEKQQASLVLASQHPVTEKEIAGKTQEELEMIKSMGFSSFDSTKNKKVKGNNVGGVHVVMKRKYRQYMNRKGGFNRPLDYVH